MSISDNLNLLCSTLEKCHIEVLICDFKTFYRHDLDLGIRRLIGAEISLGEFIVNNLPPIEDKTVYHLADKFNNNYVYLKLPDTHDKLILFIGPFHTASLKKEQITSLIEKLDVPENLMAEVEKYYNTVPFLAKNSHIFTLIEVFCENIWGGANSFEAKELNIASNESNDWYEDSLPTSSEILSWKIKIMEERYEQENKIMAAVARGDTDRVLGMMNMFSAYNFEQRTNDKLRNIQNYLIIMNTLFRKAAEGGGVHPMYLDKTSSKFALKIEQLRNIEQVNDMMQEMVKTYCKLVKKHSTKKYSLPVQRAITIIDYDLTANLTLASIAELQDINASYLSTIFKKETGVTLTDYVNKKRMEHAKKLLETTRIQIQTVAQQCGMVDVHYFSRMFKNYTGVTPKMYRETLQK